MQPMRKFAVKPQQGDFDAETGISLIAFQSSVKCGKNLIDWMLLRCADCWIIVLVA